MFCIFLGFKPAEMNEAAYLDHISDEHRGSVLNSVALYKTFCISDREYDDEEDFDINLLPLTPQEQADRRYVNFQLFMAASGSFMDVGAYLQSLDDLKLA